MWQVYVDTGRYCQPATSPALVWVYFSFDMATTLYLTFAAMPLAIKTGKHMWEKLQWLTMLLCGLFVTVIAVVRAVILASVCLYLMALEVVGTLN
jgi:hypothetical protein